MGITFQIGVWIELSVAGVGLYSHTWNAEAGVKVPQEKTKLFRCPLIFQPVRCKTGLGRAFRNGREQVLTQDQLWARQ